MESIETGLIFETESDNPIEGIPDAMTPIERRLILMRLVHAWALHLGTAITRYENGALVTDGREPLLVAQAPAQAWHLAGDLASLIDELIVDCLGAAANTRARKFRPLLENHDRISENRFRHVAKNPP
jgi:ATP-dependent helicase/nuclease subunit B